MVRHDMMIWHCREPLESGRLYMLYHYTMKSPFIVHEAESGGGGGRIN